MEPRKHQLLRHAGTAVRRRLEWPPGLQPPRHRHRFAAAGRFQHRQLGRPGHRPGPAHCRYLLGLGNPRRCLRPVRVRSVPAVRPFARAGGGQQPLRP
ncbi:hypothetical protein G6F66_014642 [Rhizopus arrhizus]|nr:hypothetical protein G6F66_014642 [Rhizopus arrhizus]